MDYNMNKNIIKARQSIFRAQQSFQTSDGKNSADLMIENESLKTTLIVLNQKIKDQEDWEDIINKLKSKNMDLETAISFL